MKNFIASSINKMSGRNSTYQIFTDWVKMTAIAISNATDMFPGEIYRQREEEYLSIAKRYEEKEIVLLGQMTGALALSLEEKMGDVLGEVYMMAGCGSKSTGQFFTPYHVAYLNARLAWENRLKQESQKEVIEVNEPSVGGGGMIIAIAQVLKEENIDYQKRLHVTAKDLDWNGVYMTYVQLSLLGIKARVEQGDSLANTAARQQNVLLTPAEKGMLF